MAFCDSYNNRALFCDGWEFCKTSFGTESPDGMVSPPWTFPTTG